MIYGIVIPLAISAVLSIFLSLYLLNQSLIFPTHVDYINVKNILVAYLFSFVCCSVVSLAISGVICFVRWIIDKFRY